MDEIVDLLFALRHPRFWDSFEAAMQAYYARADAADVSGVSPERIRSASRFYATTGAGQAGQVRKALENAGDPIFGGGSGCIAWRHSETGLPVPDDDLERMLSMDALAGDLDALPVWHLSCRAQYAVAQGRGADLEAFKAAIGAVRSQAAADEDTSFVAYIDAELGLIEAYGAWKSGDPARALPLVERYQQVVGGVIPRWWIAMINVELERTEEALPWLESFWGSDYTTMAYFELGKAYERLGRPDDPRGFRFDPVHRGRRLVQARNLSLDRLHDRRDLLEQ
jgi:hypothetical protein